jgi:hypothetical protein
MKMLTTKAEESGLDTNREGYAMEGSFVAQHVMDEAYLREIAEKWVDVESDDSVQEDEIDEAIDELDKKDEEDHRQDDFEASDEDPMECEEIADASVLAPNSLRRQPILRHCGALALQLVRVVKILIFSAN